MFFATLFSSFGRSFEMLVLSWTVYNRIAQASEPSAYDEILRHTIREVKFHAETLLTIIFFLGTGPHRPQLISWTLASLLFTLLTYTVLEAMSGDGLHKHIDTILHGRVLLALLAKVPALSVLGTLCALGATEWDTPFTTGILCALAGVIVLVLALRLKLHAAIAKGFTRLAEGTRILIHSLRQIFTRIQKQDGPIGTEKEGDKGYYANSCSTLNLPTLPRAALLV